MATRIVILLTLEKPGGWFTHKQYIVKIVIGDIETLGRASRMTMTFGYRSREAFAEAVRERRHHYDADPSCRYMEILDHRL